MNKPKDVLVTFGKTGLLPAGHKETMRFLFTAKDISSFDEYTSSWIVEKGKYLLKVGSSSRKIQQVEKFDVPNEILAGKVSEIIADTRNGYRIN